MTFERLITGVCFATSFGWLAIALVCLLDPFEPAAYLIDIFSAPLLVAAAICLIFLLLLQRPLSAGLTLIAVAGLALSLWPQMFPPRPAPDTSAEPVRLVFANLWVRNPTPEKLIPWIDSQNADIVALVEAGPQVEALTPALKARFPYMAHHHQTVIASRYPMTTSAPRHSLIIARIDTPSGPLDVATVHMPRPWPYSSPEAQPRQMERLLSDLTRRDLDRLVLVGDFNATPSAGLLREFSRRTGLTPAGSFGGTWPAVLPAPLSLSIDNAFAGPGLSLERRKAGPAYGSDHRPVRTDIYPARP